MSSIAPHHLSRLIGSIYDCAIEPDLWSNVLRDIADELRCLLSMIYLIDLRQSRIRFAKAWNFDTTSIDQKNYGAELMSLINQPFVMTQAIDEPLSTARLMTFESVSDTRYFQEVASPHGHIDSLQTIVVRNAYCIGMFSAVRHESVGFATDDDLATLRLLAPHIRRAVMISDLLELKALEAKALSSTLDALAMGVVVVADDRSILFANDAARRMLAEGSVIVSRNGRLAVPNQSAERELAKAVKICQRNEAVLGTAGIGISLSAAGSLPSIAHVLPLAQGEVRTRLVPQAAAAVFIGIDQPALSMDLSVLVQTYGLTPAELRILERLLLGGDLNEVAEALGLSRSTAKTHLANIFSKTGVSRQADLVGLILSMKLPIRSSPH